MKIKLSNIVIGTNLTGMQVALSKDATFIPVSYLPAFGWEYSEFDHPVVLQNRINKNEFEYIKQFRYQITTEQGKLPVKCFYWELEAIYKYILQMSNRLYDSQRIVNVRQYSANVVTLVSLYGNSFDIEFDTCHVINPNYEWFDSMLSPIETYQSDSTHILYQLILSKETEDMKGISYEYDIEHLEDEYFTQIWYSSMFGPKKFLQGQNIKQKKQTITTRNICLFIENVPDSELDAEKYQVSEVRKEIYKLLGTRHKRIADRVLAFDKSIDKIELSSNVDMYEDTDTMKFVYYTNKEEIICPKNLDYMDWPQSYPRTLMCLLKKSMISV